ncbi:MAG: metallophosphoesterase [Clostridia bacterium]|nr:metallophosphoesterase [Clostridia bacterium]
MVYVTGDLHGDLSRLAAPPMRRLRKGDTLLVCGDFGFVWDGSAAEQKRLARLSRLRYTVAFVDGRHENFDLLAQYPSVEWNGGVARQINERVYHLQRGQIYTIEGHTYFTFGGGESDDKEFRIPGESWWQAELPTEEEMVAARERLAAYGNRVDCIITHMPSLKSRARLHTRGSTDGVSIFLGALEDTVTCHRWYFGSLHMDKALSAQRRAVFRDVLPIEF